jgi:hypothetical protein
MLVEVEGGWGQPEDKELEGAMVVEVVARDRLPPRPGLDLRLLTSGPGWSRDLTQCC